MNPSPISLSHFEPSRQAALARLEAFVPYAGTHYAKHRNTDYGSGENVSASGLSPYLRYRVITEAEVIRAVLDNHTLQAAEKFIQEVVWRTYWKGWLQMRPSVWLEYVVERDRKFEQLASDVDLKALYQQATEGTTGIDGFDDWAKGLVKTGYLHNHARMWFASIWIFTLRLPWTLGADFFLRHLLDGDPASNTLSWRWVAGIQTQGKTYLATQENIERFTQGRYAPKGLAQEAIAIDSAPPPRPQLLPSRARPMDALDQPSVWLAHADDIRIIDEVRANPNCCGVIWHKSNDTHQAEQVSEFIKVVMLDQRRPDELVIDTLDSDEVVDRVRSMGGQQLIVCEPPVGTTAWAMKDLANLGTLPVFQCRRAYDDALWPAATKGFFPFKKQVLNERSLRKVIA